MSTSTQIPLIFGGEVDCGWAGDVYSGNVVLPLFGPGYVKMQFNLPDDETSIQVSVVSVRVGSPSAPLVLTLYGPNGTEIGSVSVSPASVPTGTPNWIPFQTFSGVFSPGYYTVVVSSPSSTSGAYYRGFIDFSGGWWDSLAAAGYNPASKAYSGNSGWSVAWIKDPSGNDLTILPFGDAIIPPSQMSFVADGNYPINCIVPYLSDMEYLFGAYSVTWLLQDLTAGVSLGNATASQYYNSHGLGGIIPFQLPSVVNLIQGHTYQISLTGGLAYVYGTLLRGSNINPAKAAPGGFNPYWWGEIALADFSLYRTLDYVNNHILTPDGIGTLNGKGQTAVRFVAPSTAKTLQSIHLKMYDSTGATENYPSGTSVVVSIYGSNEVASNGAAPTGSVLARVVIDSGTIPRNGWFVVPGFNFSMAVNTPYWVVWSAPSASTGYGPQRNVSPYRNFMQVSENSGATWGDPGQGPTDLAWYGLLTDGSYVGSPYDHYDSLSIGPVELVAQPFMLSQAATVTSIYVFATGGVITASLYPDDGTGTGPEMSSALGSATLDTTLAYANSGVIIPFGQTAVSVLADTKYWIVFSDSASGSIGAAAYWTRPTDPAVLPGFEALVSSNGGATWSAADSEIATTIFMVGVQPSGVLVQTTSVFDVLSSKGITTYSLVAYGQPSLSSAERSYYLSQGFKVYPWEDGSDGYTSDLSAQMTGFSAGGGGVLGPTYGWGYATQFYNLGRGYLATLYPNEQEYYLVSGALSPAKAYGYNGIVIDAPELIAEWLYEYSQIDANVGLKNLLGIAGWVNADHPVNYGGAQGQSGGHNMNTYVRYVNSPLALYLNDVTSNGLHVSNNSVCLLWPLAGTSANYTSATCEPTVAMATDIDTYHRVSTFSTYMAASNAYLEYQLLAAVQAKTKAFARTAMPMSVLMLVPSYYSSVLETTSSSIYGNSAGDIFLGSGGAVTCCPYFNFANPSDNSSNPGRSTYYEVATPATVLDFWVRVVPTFAPNPIMEADTEPSAIQAQVQSTSWGHFASIYSGMPYVGRFFGLEQDKAQVLVIDHNYGNVANWSALCAISRVWGTDSYASLSGLTLASFDAIVGIPNKGEDAGYAADLALIESYVSAGGNLVLYTSSGAPSSLTGIGTTAVAIPYGHPITQPYAEADLNAALPGGYGYINAFGSGRVITLQSSRYGDGFGVGDSSNGTGASDGLSSGLAYLTLNAVLWATGQPTPALYLPKYVQRTIWATPLNTNGQGGTPPVIISVCGTPSGTKLVWFSNTGTTAETVQLALSQRFFGTPSSWQAYDENSDAVVGSGSGDVALNVTIPAQDWRPLYLQISPIQMPKSRVMIVE